MSNNKSTIIKLIRPQHLLICILFLIASCATTKSDTDYLLDACGNKSSKVNQTVVNQNEIDKPRRKFISAATKEYKYALYQNIWRTKVEEVGKTNFPENIKRNKLSGSLIMDVAIKADGSVERVKVARSSGIDELDKAAVDIVNLSSPFLAFPECIRQETDILHITRT